MIDGIKSLKERCDHYSVDYEKYLELYDSKELTVFKDRYDCTASIKKRKNTTKFVVKYIRNEDVFIAWTLPESGAKRNRTGFYLNKKSLYLSKGLNQISKNLEFSGHGEEVVRVFKSEDIDEFVKTVKRTINK